MSGYRTGGGSDRVKHSTFVTPRQIAMTNAQRLQRENLFDPRDKWRDPVATAPGSVSNYVLRFFCPIPVSKSTGAGYPLPLNSAISITIFFWFLPARGIGLVAVDFFSNSDDEVARLSAIGLRLAGGVGWTVLAPDIWAKALKICVRSSSVSSSRRTPVASATVLSFSSVFVS